jgi:hypothetical protein
MVIMTFEGDHGVVAVKRKGGRTSLVITVDRGSPV